MKKWLRWFDFYTIRTKMIICFLAISIIPLFILGYLSYQYYINDLQNNVNSYTSEVIERVDQNMETYIMDVDNILDIFDDYYTIQYLRLDEAGDIDGKRKYTVRLWETIQSIKKMKSDLVDIRIISHTGQTISSQGVYWTNPDDSFYSEILQAEDDNDFVVESPYTDTFNRNIFTIGKKITSSRLTAPAIICVDIDISFLNRISNDIKLGEQGYLYFTDKEGEINYFPKDTESRQVNVLIEDEKLIDQNNGSFEKQLRGNNYLVNFKRSEITGWNIVGVTYADEVRANINKISKLTLVIGAGCLIVVVLISVYLTFILTNPLRDLRKVMKQFADDNLNIRAEVKTKDEIGQLAEKFNYLQSRIKSLLQKTMDDQVKIQQIEKKALQELIKPHFIYNTLDSIIGLLEQNRIEEALDLIEALGMFFRTSLSHGKDVIRLGSEIDHVRNYFEIQKFRFFNKFDTSIEVDEAILHYETVKLILQPIVENAIYHGVRFINHKGLIQVKGYEQNGLIILEVIDNGAGITEEKVQHINNVLDGKEKVADEDDYFGIRNVNERIKLTYGSAYGIKFESERNKGTRVKLTLPIIEK